MIELIERVWDRPEPGAPAAMHRFTMGPSTLLRVAIFSYLGGGLRYRVLAQEGTIALVT